MRALREGRPEPTLATLPEGAAYLRIVPRLDIGSVAMLVFDPDTGDDQLVPFDPGTQVDLRVSASAIVVDAHGVLYRVASDPVPVEGPTTPSSCRSWEPLRSAMAGLRRWGPGSTGPSGSRGWASTCGSPPAP